MKFLHCFCLKKLAVILSVALVLPFSACAGNNVFNPSLKEIYRVQLDPVPGTDDAFKLVCTIEKEKTSPNDFSTNTIYLPSVPVKIGTPAESCCVPENMTDNNPKLKQVTSLINGIKLTLLCPVRGVSRKVCVNRGENGEYPVLLMWLQTDGITEPFQYSGECILKPGLPCIIAVREY